MDKIRNPHKYISAVQEKDVQIVSEQSELQCERKMAMGPNTVHEHITADPYTQTVVFKGVPTEQKRGFVTNTIYEAAGELYLEFVMNWQDDDPSADMNSEQMQTTLTAAVEHTREVAEAEAKK